MLAAVPDEKRTAVLNTLTDSGGRSLLHIAVQRRHEPLAQLLLGMVGWGGGERWDNVQEVERRCLEVQHRVSQRCTWIRFAVLANPNPPPLTAAGGTPHLPERGPLATAAPAAGAEQAAAGAAGTAGAAAAGRGG